MITCFIKHPLLADLHSLCHFPIPFLVLLRFPPDKPDWLERLSQGLLLGRCDLLSQNATVLAVLCPQISLLSYLPSSGSSSVPGFQSNKGSWLGDVCWGLAGGILDRAHTIHESLKTTWRRLLLSHSSGSIASTRFSKRLEVLER